MRFKPYKKESKENWGITLCDKQQVSDEQIKLGAILRIADATELMAKNHQRLLDERGRYKRWYEEEKKCSQRLCHQISGLKGYIKRIKGKGKK